jgi:hypothetical protein
MLSYDMPFGVWGLNWLRGVTNKESVVPCLIYIQESKVRYKTLARNKCLEILTFRVVSVLFATILWAVVNVIEH